jgi:excisionase family DNA binding protein
MEFTFEQLPSAISQLYNKLDCIEKLILAKGDRSQEEADQLMTIEEAAVFAHLSKATLYGLVSRSGVPCMKKGKRLYFSRKELTEWIRAGRKKTVSEIAAEADSYLTRKAR